MNAKRTEDLLALVNRPCLRPRLRRWTVLLAVGLASLSGSLFPTPVQAAGPVSLTLKGQWLGYARGVAVAGNHAYMAANEGLQVIDVSNPANPARVGGFDTEDARAVQVVGTVAYLADGSALRILDVSNPASPVELGKFQTAATDVEVVGTLAYTPYSFFGGVDILDVSNPASPVRIGGLGDLESPYSVQVVGKLAYVAYREGLEILDVSIPASPVLLSLGEFHTAGTSSEVQVMGTLAYVAIGAAGLHILDVSNPANPVRVGGYDTSGDARDVAVVGDLIYVADGQLGLLILELSRPPWLEISRLNPFSFRVSGKPGATLRVQRSSNLRDWEDWQSATLGDAPLEFPDPDAAGATARFYRAVKQ